MDPSFTTNRHVYLYYAPPLSTPAGDAPATGTDFSAGQGVNRLSRFTLNANWTLNTSSEVNILDVPADRAENYEVPTVLVVSPGARMTLWRWAMSEAVSVSVWAARR